MEGQFDTLKNVSLLVESIKFHRKLFLLAVEADIKTASFARFHKAYQQELFDDTNAREIQVEFI